MAEDRQARIDALLSEFIVKVESLMKSFDDFKATLRNDCEKRAEKCHGDFATLYERMRSAELNIAIMQTMADTLGKAIDALSKRSFKTVYIVLVGIYALAHTVSVIYLIAKGLHN